MKVFRVQDMRDEGGAVTATISEFNIAGALASHGVVAPEAIREALNQFLGPESDQPATTEAEGVEDGSEDGSATNNDDDDLPDDFPGHAALTAAGITTYGELRDVEDLTDISGIGEATAEKIKVALAG